METNLQDQTKPEPTATAPKFKVFGVGSAGVNLANRAIAGGLPAAAFVAVAAKEEKLAGAGAAEKVKLEVSPARRVEAGGSFDQVRAAVDLQLPRLKELAAGAEVVFVLAGLGGATGTQLAPRLAAVVRESGAVVISCVVLPFECEGNMRTGLAREGLAKLQEGADLVICLPNQRAIGMIDETASLKDTFLKADQLLAESVAGVWRALLSENGMGLPFLDICALVRRRSHDCSLAVVEAAGPNRVNDAVEKLLVHPLLEGPANLKKAEALGVYFLGGAGLSMVEINRAMEQIHRHAEDVPLLMGVGVAQEGGDRLSIVLLLARPTGETADPAEAEAETATAPSRMAEKPVCGVKSGDIQLLDHRSSARTPSRFVPPAPALTPEKRQQLINARAGRKGSPKFRQAQLPLEIVSKGRFDKSQPTIYKGEDLDIPTYIRRGMVLN